MLRAYSDHLVLQRVPGKDTSPGGIFIPEVARRQPIICEIRSTGPDVTTVKKGQRVVIPMYTGREHEHEGKKYLLVREEDLLATIEE